MFGNLFKKFKSQSTQMDGANYCFSPLRTLYNHYSGDAAFIKPVNIDGFEEKEVNLQKAWPLLDVTSLRGNTQLKDGQKPVLFDPDIVTRIEVTHKRLELMFRGFSNKLGKKNYDEYEKHTNTIVERCGVLFQQKKFVFNSAFNLLDRTEQFEEQSYHDFVDQFLNENPKGFRHKFGELVTEEFKAYTAIKKLLSTQPYQKAVKFLLVNHERNISKLSGDDLLGEILVRNFHQNEGASALESVHKDELLRLENKIEKIANAYFIAWKNQLNFIYEWYPILSAATLIKDAPERVPTSKLEEEALI
ncbi:hypothetical protein [Marinicellulosiphila megalodicopiae]|uniref:hypothetical protein n=1 Tax=Marinicellulosiphila megalodicopiae TaxID=2724896 RepID=UPI003BB0019F